MALNGLQKYGPSWFNNNKQNGGEKAQQKPSRQDSFVLGTKPQGVASQGSSRVSLGALGSMAVLALSKMQGAFAATSMTRLPNNHLGVTSVALPAQGSVPGLDCGPEACVPAPLNVTGLQSLDAAVTPALSSNTTYAPTVQSLVQVMGLQDSTDPVQQLTGREATLSLRNATNAMPELAANLDTLDQDTLMDVSYRLLVLPEAGDANPAELNQAGRAAWGAQFDANPEMPASGLTRLANGDNVAVYVSARNQTLNSIPQLSDLALPTNISYFCEPYQPVSQPQTQRAAALGANVVGSRPPQGVAPMAPGDSAFVRAVTGLLPGSYNDPETLVADLAPEVMGADAGKSVFQALNNDAATIVQAQTLYPNVSFVPDSVELTSATTQNGMWNNATSAWTMAMGARAYRAAGNQTFSDARSQVETAMLVGNVDAATQSAVLQAYDNTNAVLSAVGSTVNGTNPVAVPRRLTSVGNQMLFADGSPAVIDGINLGSQDACGVDGMPSLRTVNDTLAVYNAWTDLGPGVTPFNMVFIDHTFVADAASDSNRTRAAAWRTPVTSLAIQAAQAMPGTQFVIRSLTDSIFDTRGMPHQGTNVLFAEIAADIAPYKNIGLALAKEPHRSTDSSDSIYQVGNDDINAVFISQMTAAYDAVRAVSNDTFLIMPGILGSQGEQYGRTAIGWINNTAHFKNFAIGIDPYATFDVANGTTQALGWVNESATPQFPVIVTEIGKMVDSTQDVDMDDTTVRAVVNAAKQNNMGVGFFSGEYNCFPEGVSAPGVNSTTGQVALNDWGKEMIELIQP